ncbi:hypothetical protein COOONC_10658, partial [Cooperia oncophora]
MDGIIHELVLTAYVSIMNTPLVGSTVQGTKRTRINVDSSPLDSCVDDHGLRDAINLMNSDPAVPAHLKTIIGHLLDKILQKDRELDLLRKRDLMLVAENDKLKNEIASLKGNLAVPNSSTLSQSCNPSLQPIDSNANKAFDPHEECERARSVVKLFCFLDIECMPVTCYRMGRPRHGVPRLLKIVLPTRKFQSLLLKRAPRLRFFPVKGVFVRPSLTWEERVQRRANITSPHQSAPPKEVSAHNVSLQSSSSHHSAADPPMSYANVPVRASGNIYRSPSCLGESFSKLLKCIGDLTACEYSCALVGDFNLPDIEWASNPTCSSTMSKSFLDLCSNYGYLQLVKSPTRQGNTLDLILCNDPSLISDVAIHAPIGTSDHCSLSAALQSRHVRRSLTYCLDYKMIFDWIGSLSTVDTVNDKYEMLLEIINQSLLLFTPVRKISPSNLMLPQYL